MKEAGRWGRVERQGRREARGPRRHSTGRFATRSCDQVDRGGAAPLAVGRAPETDQTLEDEGRSRPSA